MTSPTSLRTVDIRLIDDVFEMSGGYVLDFTDRTFAEFFREELGVNIDDPKFEADGRSKAKRLRTFLRAAPPDLCRRALESLWEYRQAALARAQKVSPNPAADQQFADLVVRLGGKSFRSSRAKPADEPANTIDVVKFKTLKERLIEVSSLAPQPRGYAYEKFLKDLFDANGLSARSSFRLVGEQIDGSFELASDTYLLEAKWTGAPIGAADLRSFNAKVEEKAAWSRGLFVSDSGFSEDGLQAFGRGKRVVCMDGLDLWDMLDRGLHFHDVMARKVRRAAESGSPFARVRDLYP